MFEFDDFELHVQHSSRGAEGPVADSRVKDWWFNNTIRYNDDGRRTWRTFDDKLFDAYTFHELLHIVDRNLVDDDTKGPLFNVHTIQGIINSSFESYPVYKDEVRRAREKCEVRRK